MDGYSTHSSPDYSQKPWWPSDSATYTPGVTATKQSAPDANRKPLSAADRIGDWFERPLQSFEGEDSIVCLMVCLPLIEKYIRFLQREKEKGGDEGFGSSMPDSSPMLRDLARFLEVPKNIDAMNFYSAIRNGMLHRGMPNENVNIQLRPERTGHKPVEVVINGDDRSLIVYVWILRDKVVKEILRNNAKLWKRDDTPLLDIYDL